jgi:hypothetical protein
MIMDNDQPQPETLQPEKRGPGRPRKAGRPPFTPEERLIRNRHRGQGILQLSKEAESMTPEDVIEKLIAASAYDSAELYDRSRKRGLSESQLRKMGLLSRNLVNLAQAKKAIVEIARGDDLSKIPTEQLVKVIVRQLRTQPELKAAVAAELGQVGGPA